MGLRAPRVELDRAPRPLEALFGARELATMLGEVRSAERGLRELAASSANAASGETAAAGDATAASGQHAARERGMRIKRTLSMKAWC